MANVNVGMKGLMIDGIFIGKTVTVREVIDEEWLVIEVEEHGQVTLCHIPRDQFRLFDPREAPSPECPYQVGDILFVHQQQHLGFAAVVTGVSERHGRLVLNLNGKRVVEDFDNVTLVSPLRREVLPDYLKALERAHPFMGHSQRRDFWWADHLGGPMPTAEEELVRLGEEYERFRRASLEEQEADLERRKRELLERFGPLSPEARVERWCQEFREWVGHEAFSDRFVADKAREYFSAEELKRIEEDAVQKGPAAFFQLSAEENVSEERLRAHAVEQRVLDRMNEGFGLQRSTERAQRRVPLRARYETWRAQVLPSEEERARERQRLRAEVWASAEDVRARIQRSHGLPLPDHVFEFWACWRALHPEERKAMAFLGIEPMGLFDFFEAAGPRPRGVDPRLHERAYRDPPEFVPVVRGGEGSLRFGLWYDDPGELPRLVTSYSTYSIRLDVCPGTLLQAVREHIEQCLMHFEFRTPSEEDWLWLRYALARDALAAFEQGAAPAPAPLGGYRVPTQDDVGALLRWESFVDEKALERLREGFVPDEPAELKARAEAALMACAAGDPTRALVLGRDLHWCSWERPDREAAAARLLEAAYRALGRPGLAEVAVLHHRHRHPAPAAAPVTARA